MIITVETDSGIIQKTVAGPVTLSGAMLDMGLSIKMPCGGNGRCGKCKVVATGKLSNPTEREMAFLSPEECKAHVRIACLAKALGDVFIRLPKQKESSILIDGVMGETGFAPWGSFIGAAVDIGTTTVAAYLFDLKTGRILGVKACPNPQCSYGADVMSRLDKSLQGERGELKRSIVSCIDSLVRDMCAGAQRNIEEVDSAVLTGNTAMLYLLCGEDPTSIAKLPFVPNRYFGEHISAKSIGLSWHESCRIYLPRCISAYIGADITTGILSSGLTGYKRPAILMDIGTNGEMVLAKDGVLLCCSTAAGPAFEGAGISMGSTSVSGAIFKAYLQNEQLKYETIGGAAPASICGSGLVDAVACLLELGVIDETGVIDKARAKSLRLLGEGGETRVSIGKSPVYLTQKDIRAVQLAKSAICAGMLTLLNHGEMCADELASLLIAGGLGSSLNILNAEKIGLIPEGASRCALAIGNAACMGAIMLLRDRSLLAVSESYGSAAHTIDLSSDPVFMEKFVDCMYFE